MNKIIVYLVGAGPGDPKLITLKAMECIKKSDVLVYDRLVNEKLLSFARQDTELIYVGKSSDKHTLKQEEINQLLIRKAKEGNIVTRLKGGDPFVFGRGGEEAEALYMKGIPFEIVPGVSSAVAVPAYAGIPVTHRGMASSLSIVTGHEDPTKDSVNVRLDKIVVASDTIVFLMGMENLTKIVEQLISNGRSVNTPVALIQSGTLPEQKTLVGRLDNIVRKAEDENFKSPAVIVVGEVVNLRDRLKWFENMPLYGKKILVTRSRQQSFTLSEKIQDLGGQAIEFPVIEINPPLSFDQLDCAINSVEKYDWIIFTSTNGVQKFFSRLKVLNKDIRKLKDIKLCAIGLKTAQELDKLGLLVDFVPEEYRAEAIIEWFRLRDIKSKKILLPRADIARETLAVSLESMGAIVDNISIYQTVSGKPDSNKLVKLLEEKSLDIITFTSSSTVKYFCDILKTKNLVELLKGITVVSIGPITTFTALEYGITIDIQAAEYTIDGLIKAIEEKFERTKKND